MGRRTRRPSRTTTQPEDPETAIAASIYFISLYVAFTPLLTLIRYTGGENVEKASSLTSAIASSSVDMFFILGGVFLALAVGMGLLLFGIPVCLFLDGQAGSRIADGLREITA